MKIWVLVACFYHLQRYKPSDSQEIVKVFFVVNGVDMSTPWTINGVDISTPLTTSHDLASKN